MRETPLVPIPTHLLIIPWKGSWETRTNVHKTKTEEGSGEKCPPSPVDSMWEDTYLLLISCFFPAKGRVRQWEPNPLPGLPGLDGNIRGNHSVTEGKGLGYNFWKNDIVQGHNINWLESNVSKMAAIFCLSPCSESSNKTLCAPGPRDPTETEPLSVWVSPAEARVSSGRCRGRGSGCSKPGTCSLWHTPSWRRSPLIPP